ncbi:MAG: thiamine diphosphokinase, partial [Chloroflexi bacterium]|nr:thiamine diphosphokinase [Chloroflexota bacterium]
TELALLEAAAMGATRITLLGALGGRVDHQIANLMLLAMPQLAGIETVIYDGRSRVLLADGEATLRGEVGDTVSLIPLGGDAEGIETSGLQYPLRDETLRFGPARGVSNVLVAPIARITARSGRLLVVHTPQQHLGEPMAPETGERNPFAADAVARAYDDWYETPLGAAVVRLQKELVLRLAEPRAGERALDVGTGTGLYAVALAGQGLHVTGLDSSEAMLSVARAKPAPVTWQQGDAASLPFGDESYDLVLCITGLEFMADYRRALAEMYRVLAPGGRFVAGVLNVRSAWGRMYFREAQRDERSPFRHAHLFDAGEFVAAISVFGEVQWNSAVFFGPTGRGLWAAGLLERLGQTLCRDQGSLLVGRVSK